MATAIQAQQRYILPNGLNVAAVTDDGPGYALYTPAERTAASPARYRLDADGRITRDGVDTSWRIIDLQLCEPGLPSSDGRW